MRKKSQQIRDDMRKQHIQKYMAKQRKQILQNYLQDYEVHQINIKVRTCIDNNNIDGLFDLFLSIDKYLFYYINSQNIIPTYLLLLNSLENTTNLVLLQHLVTPHFNTIFNNSLLVQINENLIERVFVITNALVIKIRNKQIQYETAISKGLTVCLRIIKSFFTQPHLQLNWFSKSKKIHLVHSYIIPWGRQLLINLQYLIILVSAMSDSQVVVHSGSQLRVLQQDEALCMILIGGMSTNDCQLYFSVISIIIETQLPLCKQFLVNILQPYLKVMSLIYQGFTTKTNFKFTHVLQSISDFKIILGQIIKSNIIIHNFGELLSKYFIFVILNNHFGCQNQNNRQVIIDIIASIVQILCLGNEQMSRIVKKDTIAVLVMALQTNSAAMVLASLGIIRIILRTIQLQMKEDNEYASMLNCFYEAEIILALEQLQFRNPSTEIGNMATAMLQHQFKEQDYPQSCFNPHQQNQLF